MAKKTAHVYVDGFNLYYGVPKKHPKYRWLDLAAICREAPPQYDVCMIRYFTALINPRPWKLDSLQDQLTYIRALRTIPNLEVHMGKFLLKDTKGDELDSTSIGSDGRMVPTGRVVHVRSPEEKGSDVNMAAYLLLDCFDNLCEAAVLVSGDSDLATPIRLVRDRFNKEVSILDPRRRVTFELQQASSNYRSIFTRSLRSSQFPPILTDSVGTITRPEGWK